MSLDMNVSVQESNPWKKKINVSGLTGSLYLLQRANGSVDVSASANHQNGCKIVLGPPNKESSLASYIMWENVSASDLAELIWEIAR